MDQREDEEEPVSTQETSGWLIDGARYASRHVGVSASARSPIILHDFSSIITTAIKHSLRTVCDKIGKCLIGIRKNASILESESCDFYSLSIIV